MAAYLEDSYDAVRARIAAVWTDVDAANVWEAEHVSMVPWEDVTIPMASIVIRDAPLAEEWGMQNQARVLPVEVYYAAEITGDSSSIRGKLEELRDDLVADNIGFGQVLDVSDLQWGPNLMPNEVFNTKNYTQRAGLLTFQLLVGETVTV